MSRIHASVLAAFGLLLVPLAEGKDGPMPSSDPLIDQLVAAHNQARAREDLKPLKPDAKLMEAARLHALDMAEQEKLSHQGSDGSTPAERVKTQGYQYVSTGENVAEGQKSVSEVMETWMNSPGHRRNILGDFSEIGASRAKDAEGRFYWVVDFGRPVPQLDPERAARAVIGQINRERTQAGKPALKEAPQLSDAARAVARDMAQSGTLQRRNGGPSVIDMVRREGYPFGEIQQSMASGYATPEEFVKSLTDSKNRDSAVFGAHEHVGAGYGRAGDGTPYWVVLFASPAQRP